MVLKYLKLTVIYGGILALGLAIGHFAPRAYEALKPQYTEGDYTSFYDGTVKIAIYGTSTCPYCAKTRAFLRDRNIQFSDFDISKDENAKKRFAALDSKSVPVVLVGNRRINGFNAAALKSALEAAGQHDHK